MRLILCAVFMLLFAAVFQAQAVVRGQTFEYRQDNTVLEGYLAYDDAFQGKRPGVLIIHEWKGITAYERSRADQLAALGYVALAADIYGKGVRATNTDEAKRLSATYRSNRQLFRARAQAGLETLRANPRTDPARLAAIGYCFGGTGVLELARSGANVSGVVSFHGGLDTPSPGDAKNIKARVLVLTGADDPMANAQQRQSFEDEMRKAAVDWQMNLYGGAVHSFSNPGSGNNPASGVAYNEKADKRSWKAMQLFFKEIFT